jgi:hypothetical protein
MEKINTSCLYCELNQNSSVTQLITQSLYHLNRPIVTVNILNNQNNLKYEVFTAVTMKNAVFWDVTLCGTSESVARNSDY